MDRGGENVFMFAKGEHNLKGLEPVGARKDIAPCLN